MPKIIITEREYDVLELIAQGLTNKEIAEKLCVTINTVITHIHNLYSKVLIDGQTCQSAIRVRLVLKFQNNEFEKKIYYGKNRNAKHI